MQDDRHPVVRAGRLKTREEVMNVSLLKITWLIATFRKNQVPQYLLDLGNNWVADAMSENTRAHVALCLSRGKKILAAMHDFARLCPEKWRSAYELTVKAFETVVAACEDYKLTMDELNECAIAFKIAYAEWCAD